MTVLLAKKTSLEASAIPSMPIVPYPDVLLAKGSADAMTTLDLSRYTCPGVHYHVET